MRRISKIGAAAAGLMLAGGATAAAVAAPPEAADEGLTRAQDEAGFEVPAANEDHPTSEEHPGGGQPESLDAADADAADGTHGAEVSVVAHDDSTTGREHGEAVSQIAQGEHGAVATDTPVDGPNAGGISTADAASGGASEVGTDRAADSASLGSANAGDHHQR
jgi:hypothetical protein